MANFHPLEDKHKCAVNPYANTFYWNDIRDAIAKYKIKRKTTFGSDKIGILACKAAEHEHIAIS